MSTVFISPDSMSYLASDAATSINLAWKGYQDEAVVAGLERGKQFCDVLQQGMSERKNTSEFFSARGLAAEGFVGWVLKLDELRGQLTPDHLSRIHSELDALSDGVQKKNPKPLTKAKARELFQFFDIVARTLSHQSALIRRVVRSPGA